MRYISTRGQAPVLSFCEVVLAGLASDGGLYVPETIPHVTPATLQSWKTLSYSELALEVMWPFVDEDTALQEATADHEVRGVRGGGTPPVNIHRSDFARMIDASYASFRHPEVTPVSPLAPNHYQLELFHGPTLAFKDVALQLLGRLLDHLLVARGERAVVLGATSGDTGSAAIAGCIASAHMDCVILYPNGRVSDVQRRQMTTVPNANIHALALDGTFDDCQNIVKHIFADAAFRSGITLVAVNSINWARILAQVVYYFYAALKLGAPETPVSFSVPTGNFGDIFAGYIAKKMGLPIEKLIIASNRNDILTRCMRTGEYRMDGVHASLSPSMDIEISSNFERLLFDVHGRDAALMRNKMQQFKTEKTLKLSPEAHAAFAADFAAHAIDDATTLATIQRHYEATGILLDPHTAVGVAASEALLPTLSFPVITLATAHAAKFPDAVRQATGQHPALPTHLANLFDLPERMAHINNSITDVQTFVRKLAA